MRDRPFPWHPHTKRQHRAQRHEELTTDNMTNTATKSGKSYDFNTAEKLNPLLVELLLATSQLVGGGEY